MTPIFILNIPVVNATIGEVVLAIQNIIKEGKPKFIVTGNVLTFIESSKNQAYREILKKAEMVLPDGAGVMLASRLVGKPLRAKISGIDLLTYLFHAGENTGYKFFFVGAESHVIEKAVSRITKQYPKLKVVGFHDGYFEDESKLIEQIKSAKPDILIVGMGQPKQEQWIFRNLNIINVPVSIGVGGSYDVWGDKLKRAPLVLRKTGFEWFFRAIQEPKRFLKLIKLPYFFLLLLNSNRNRFLLF